LVAQALATSLSMIKNASFGLPPAKLLGSKFNTFLPCLLMLISTLPSTGNFALPAVLCPFGIVQN